MKIFVKLLVNFVESERDNYPVESAMRQNSPEIMNGPRLITIIMSIMFGACIQKIQSISFRGFWITCQKQDIVIHVS